MRMIDGQGNPGEEKDGKTQGGGEKIGTRRGETESGGTKVGLFWQGLGLELMRRTRGVHTWTP